MTRMEPDKALDSLEHEVWNHLYSGLDLAKMELDCLSEKAFCSAVLEQTLRGMLVDAGIITTCSRDTAGKLLNKAKQKELLPEEADQAASDLIAMRNEVIHQRLEALKGEALKAMDYLGVVLQELGRQSTRHP